jgi:hypothetical protein
MHFSHLSTVAATALVLFPSAISAWKVTMYDQDKCAGGTQYGASLYPSDYGHCWTSVPDNDHTFDAKSVYINDVSIDCQFYAFTDRNRDCNIDDPNLAGTWHRFDKFISGCQE